MRDITDNPKDLKFAELEAAQLPRSLEDVDAAVINGNYAIEADLTPAKDALAAGVRRTTPTPTSSPSRRATRTTRAWRSSPSC